MHRIWLKNYPETVRADIDVTRYASLPALFEETFAKHRNAPAYSCMGATLTFGDIDRLSQQLAAYLQSLGLQRGARVAIQLPNVLQYPVALVAVLRAGFIAVNVNPLYTARELEHQLKDSGSEAIIVLENFAATLQSIVNQTPIKHVIVARMGDLLGGTKGAIVNFAVKRVKKMVPAYMLPDAVPFKTALRDGAAMTFKRHDIRSDDTAVLQYTGGTTGVSKGAVLQHRTLISAVLGCEVWMAPGLAKKPPTGQMTIACALPLYHVFALVVCGLLGMRAGALNVLIPNPRDMKATLATLKKYRINIFPGVNTLFNGLIAQPDFKTLDFSELAITIGGGMAVQSSVAQRWLEITGCPIVEGYGLSETSAAVVCNRTDSNAYTGTIGMPMPSVEVTILSDDGRRMALNDIGEIAIRGPQVMTGYWQRPDETAKSITADGFFKSGDLGFMDADGLIKIVDRKKDMILVSGFNVYPNEIEDVVACLPGIAECAAVGVPDPVSGEAVALYVVARDPKLTKEDVAAYCRTQLTGYKQPRRIEFRQDLPKTNVGKILRRELRNEAVKA